MRRCGVGWGLGMVGFGVLRGGAGRVGEGRGDSWCRGYEVSGRVLWYGV